MKTSGNYNNGQPVKEQKDDILTYYHKDGKIKAQGKCIDGSFEGKWEFFKKEGFLWGIGHFKTTKNTANGYATKPMAALRKNKCFRMVLKLNSGPSHS